MCLLFVKPATADNLTAEQVADFHRKNSDGYGVMYAKDGKLHLNKAIGTVESWTKFYLEHQALGKEHGIDMAFHLRMRTHGEVNNENTHPYPVFGFEEPSLMPVAMMHNGILKTGNNADTTKSDTWHYIRDFLHIIAKDNPKIIFTDAFKELLASHIGTGNKFVLMNHLGEMQIINKSAGKTWNGIWFSNTYAWNPNDTKLYPGFYQTPVNTYPIRYPTYGSLYGGDDDFEFGLHTFGERKGGNKVTVFPKAEDKSTTVVNKSPAVVAHKHMTRRERKAHMRYLRAKERSLERVSTDLATYVWTDDDYDYVTAMLTEPMFVGAEKVITDPQIVSMLTMYGYQRTFFLIEEVVSGNLTVEDFIECFRDQRKAASYFKLRYGVVNTAKFLA